MGGWVETNKQKHAISLCMTRMSCHVMPRRKTNDRVNAGGVASNCTALHCTASIQFSRNSMVESCSSTERRKRKVRNVCFCFLFRFFYF